MPKPITLTPNTKSRHLLRDAHLRIYDASVDEYILFEETDSLSGINFVSFKLGGEDLIKLRDRLNQVV